MKTNEAEMRSLMRDIQNEAIDKGEWLKRKDIEDIQKQHAARQTPATIADALIRHGYLELEHRDYGFDYLELRNALYGPLNAKTAISLFSIGPDTRVSRGRAEKIYSAVSKRLGPAEKFISGALMGADNGSAMHEFTANVYRVAFEILSREMFEAIIAVKDEE